jgi:polysaccharide export outer membrane protein
MKLKIWFLTLLFPLISSCSSVPEEYQKEPLAEEQIQTIETELWEEVPQEEPADTLSEPTQVQQVPEELPEKIVPEQRNPDEILSSYRVGKGDNISLKVFGEPDFSVTARLSREGSISYPFLGELELAGLTVSQIEQKITSGLKGDYLVDPKVTVTVLEYRQLFVNGQVQSPGGYAFEPGMTVNKAISLAGGFAESASRDEIFVIRDGSVSATPSPAKLDTYLGPGDILIVKEYQKFYVNGAVRNPGSYGFIPNLTVEKAISIAGGLGEYANSWSKIYIIREGDETQTPTRVEMKTAVYPGDIIKVEESPF